MNETSAVGKMEVTAIGVIVSDLKLNVALSGAKYCFFRLKIAHDKSTDYISVKSWNVLAEGIVQFCAKGEWVEITGDILPFNRESKIKVLGADGELSVDMTDEPDGNITLNLLPQGAPCKPSLVHHNDRYILCKSFSQI